MIALFSVPHVKVHQNALFDLVFCQVIVLYWRENKVIISLVQNVCLRKSVVIPRLQKFSAFVTNFCVYKIALFFF